MNQDERFVFKPSVENKEALWQSVSQNLECQELDDELIKQGKESKRKLRR